MVLPLLAAFILLAYAASLWWLLRREDVWTLLWLAGLTSLCLALRLVYTRDYPAGMNEDEVKILWCTISLLRQGKIFVEDCTGVPALLSMTFEAQLAEIIGPTRWAIRSYSMLGSVLAVPAGFAAARSLGLRVAPSLAAAGFFATLPWSIFYGRVHQSGDMVFHELLVVNALARFVRGRGGLPEIAMGALGLCLLFYGYFSGRVLLGLTFVAAVLAPGRYRLACLGVVLIAALGWLPYVQLSGSHHVWLGLSGQQTQAEYVENPLETLRAKTVQALRALVEPVAFDQWLTIRTGAIHPLLILALAAIGSLTGVRRGLFLWAGFLGGLAPTILGYSPFPSTRRMLMAFPFIALAAACALDLLPRPRLRQIVCAAVVLIVGVQSVRFYFSTDFFLPWSTWIFDAERTALVEAIPMPPHPRLIISPSLGYFYAPRTHYEDSIETLSAANLFPPDGEEMIYAFDQKFALLQPLYYETFGIHRVQSFHRAFLVRLEARDWSELRRHGWNYDLLCQGAETRSTQVPVVFHVNFSWTGVQCATSTFHVWRARWQGAAAKLRLRFTGKADVETGSGFQQRREGWEEIIDFDISPQEMVTLRLELPPGVEILAAVVELTEAGERVPSLDSFAPAGGDARATPPRADAPLS